MIAALVLVALALATVAAVMCIHRRPDPLDRELRTLIRHEGNDQ